MQKMCSLRTQGRNYPRIYIWQLRSYEQAKAKHSLISLSLFFLSILTVILFELKIYLSF